MSAVTTTLPQLGIKERISTRLIFCLSGITLGAWAPLVPVAKDRLAINEGTLGLLLLCMGVGSILAMPMTAFLTSRFGCRQIITLAAAGLVLMLPILTIAPSSLLMAAALVLFGMVMGCNSVAMNLQAVLVERGSGLALMSGFHALFSLGGIVGSASIAFMMAWGVTPTLAAVFVAASVALLLIVAIPGLLPYSDDSGEKAPAFVIPKGIVIVIGILALMAMLAEGAVLDWGALFLIQVHDADRNFAGFGYTAFATAMTVGRLLGDAVRTRFGDNNVLFWSAVLATFGFVVALVVPSAAAGIGGFLLIGAGISNLIPILFTLTGKTKSMPANLALASVFTVGYVGIIAGPAAVGFVAHLFSLQIAFVILCLAVAVIAASARTVVSKL